VHIIGIAGGSGSGKTTFANKVLDYTGDCKFSVLHMDSYYLSEQKEGVETSSENINFDHPNTFDWKLLREHLNELKSGLKVNAPIYDFKTNSRAKETEVIEPSKVLLFEGIFSLFDKEIRNMLDIKVFLRVDADIRFTRRLHRDVNERGRSLESVIAQYYATVRPMYQKYLEPQKEYADFTVGEETDNAAKILAARLRELREEE
jgi:uridine kinase